MLHLFHTSRHLLLATAIHNHGSLSAHTAGCAHCIHRRITATNNSHARSAHYRSVVSGVSGSHQIDTGQILIARHHADIVLTRNAHKSRQTCSGSHKYPSESHFMKVVIA